MEKEFEDQNLYSVEAQNFGLLNKFYVNGIKAKKLIKDITSEKSQFKSIVIKINNQDEFHHVLTHNLGSLDDFLVDAYSLKRLMNIDNTVRLIFNNFEKSKKRKYDDISNDNNDIPNDNNDIPNDNNDIPNDNNDIPNDNNDIPNDNVIDDNSDHNVSGNDGKINFDQIYYMDKRNRSSLSRKELNEFMKTIINKLIDRELSFPKEMINRAYRTTLTIIGGLSTNYIARAKLDKMKAFSRDIYDSLSMKKLDDLLQSYKSRSTIIGEIKEILSFDPNKKLYGIKWNNNARKKY